MSVDRWDAFTREESQMIHHALRVYTTHPLVSVGDSALAARIADELWERFAAQVAARPAPAEDGESNRQESSSDA